jgi:hypothetical protein
MINNWLQWLPLLIFPVIIVIFNYIIRRKIPDKSSRQHFKQKNEYLIKLVYLFTPLLLLYFEMWLLIKGYPLSELNTLLMIVLILLQVYLFVAAIVYFVLFFKALNKYKK